MKTLILSIALLLGSILTTHAQDFYLPVSSTSPTAKAAYYQGAEYAAHVDIQKAQKELEKAYKTDPNFFMAYVLSIYYTQGEKKAELIDKALTLPTANLNKAEQIVRQQLVIWDDNPDAKIGDNMKALVAAYPNAPQAWEWSALHALYTDGDAAAALKNAQKLAQISPKYAPNYNVMGYLYLDKNQMKEAKAAFKKYIKLAPNQANPYDSMGDYYMKSDKYAKAAKFYDKAAAKGLPSSKERAEQARAKLKEISPNT